jgi:hypothetical protein
MFARTAALGRISKEDVSKAHVRRSVGDNSQDDCLNGQHSKRFLLQSSKNDLPCVRPSHENRQNENCWWLGEERLRCASHEMLFHRCQRQYCTAG